MLSPLGALGLTSILLIVALIVLLFGASLIPRFFRSLGQLRGEFRHGKADEANDRS